MNQEVQTVLRAVEGILTDKVGLPDETGVFRTLRCLYLWHLRLGDEGNEVWQAWRSQIIPRVPKRSRAEVEDLRAKFYTAAAKSGRLRQTYDFVSLRRAFPYFTRPTALDVNSFPFEDEALQGYRQQVATWAEERYIAAYKTLQAINGFLHRAETLFGANGRESEAAKKFAAIVADAHAVKGSTLINMGFEREQSPWITDATRYAEHSDWLREMLARLAIHGGDVLACEEWLVQVRDENARLLIAALIQSERGEHEEAIHTSRLVQGLRRAVAVNAILAGRADGDHVVYADLLKAFLDPDGRLSRDVMSDLVQPTAKGYARYADALLPIVRRLLR